MSPNGLPSANRLDNGQTKEDKVYKRVASTILRLADSNWWANAPKMKGSHKLVGVLQGLNDHKYTVEILSSPFGEESEKGKLVWCSKNLPEEFTAYNIRSDKEALACSHTVLIDDREKVCSRFQEAGGHAILYNELWMAELLSVVKNNPITTIYVDLDGVLVDTQKHLISTLKEIKMNTVATQNPQAPVTQVNPKPVFAGIIKVGHEDVTITEDTRDTCETLTEENGLTRLPESKLHCTLGHQSIDGLKAALKAQKKALKKGENDPIVLPATPLPVIDTAGSTVCLVEDVNPKNGDNRKTVRIVLRQELQNALASYVTELCDLNGFVRDEIEMQRIFHISYSNKTGLPGDSVR